MEELTGSDPRRVGPYEILGRLGQGGMGTVHLGICFQVRAVNGYGTSNWSPQFCYQN